MHSNNSSPRGVDSFHHIKETRIEFKNLDAIMGTFQNQGEHILSTWKQHVCISQPKLNNHMIHAIFHSFDSRQTCQNISRARTNGSHLKTLNFTRPQQSEIFTNFGRLWTTEPNLTTFIVMVKTVLPHFIPWQGILWVPEKMPRCARKS